MNLLLSAGKNLSTPGYSLLRLENILNDSIGDKTIAIDKPYMLMIEDGSARIMAADQLYRLEERALLFAMRPGFHTVFLGKDCKGYLLTADTDLLLKDQYFCLPVLKGLQQGPLQCKLFQLSQDSMLLFARLLKEMYKETLSPRIYSSSLIQVQLIQLLIHAERQCSGKDLMQTQRLSPDLCDRLGELILQHFVSHKTVSFYAKQLHLHPNHLNKLIKQQSGYTVKEWIKRTVISESKSLLVHTRLSVKEISARLGFLTPDHLSRYFKRETSVNLVTYRKQHSLIETRTVKSVSLPYMEDRAREWVDHLLTK